MPWDSSGPARSRLKRFLTTIRSDVSHADLGQGQVLAMTAMLTYFPELTIFERCDRCGTLAKVRAVFRNQAELLFCGHHFHEHKKQLLEVAAAVQLSP
jgi:hypothetical protein